MNSRYQNNNKKGMSSSSSSSSSSTSSGRSRSSSSSSSRSRSNSPDTRRRNRRDREYSTKLSTTTTMKNRYYDDERSYSSNSDNSREPKYQQPIYKDVERNKDSTTTAFSKTRTTSSSSSPVDYNSIRSDKSSESTTTSGGGRNLIGTDKYLTTTTKISSGNYEKVPEAPAPPKISTKSTPILFGKPGTVTKPGIQMKLIPPKAKTETTKKITVASAFNNESDDEVEEEMPAECRMRMRNIGRDTPTSSGPNSFGKTKQGFVDTKKVFERSLREACAD